MLTLTFLEKNVYYISFSEKSWVDICHMSQNGEVSTFIN